MDTKTILIGGAGLAALYVLSQSSGGATGFGGGGGALPLLPQLDDSGGDGGGDTFNFEDIFKTPDFSGFGADPSEGDVKKTTKLPSDVTVKPMNLTEMVKQASPAESVFLSMATTATPHPMMPTDSKKGSDVRVLGDLRTDRETAKGRAWWNPFSWDRADAIENYLEYSQSTYGTDKNFLGKTVGGGNLHAGMKMPSPTHKIVTSKKVAAKREKSRSTSASRGYSQMMRGVTHAPGWKQMGLSKPTAPGQPDRY